MPNKKDNESAISPITRPIIINAFYLVQIMLKLKKKYKGANPADYGLKEFWDMWEDAGKEAREIINKSMKKTIAESKNA